MWKLLTGIEGIDHERLFFFSFECEKGDTRSKRLEVHKDGEDYDLLIFLSSFRVFSGFETPRCNSELGIPLVPTPLVATMNSLVKWSLKNLLALVHLSKLVE